MISIFLDSNLYMYIINHTLIFSRWQEPFGVKIEDTEGDDISLNFLRDSTGREIDFVVNRNGKPAFAVECKTGAHTVSKNIAYFSTRTNIPFYYQVHMDDKDYELAASNIRVIPFTRFCQVLNL